MDLEFHKNHGKWFVTPVMRAVRRYHLVASGERLAVGLSGGKDSVTLLYILWYLRRYAGLALDLSAIHVRIMPGYESAVLAEYCETLGIPYIETSLALGKGASADWGCSICARLKRGAAARALAAEGIGILAYGHHADDAAETLLINVVQHRRLATFAPKVRPEAGGVTIIRPLFGLSERTVAAIHRRLGLPLLAFDCPYAAENIRTRYKAALRLLEQSLGTRSLAGRITAAAEASRAW